MHWPLRAYGPIWKGVRRGEGHCGGRSAVVMWRELCLGKLLAAAEAPMCTRACLCGGVAPMGSFAVPATVGPVRVRTAHVLSDMQ